MLGFFKKFHPQIDQVFILNGNAAVSSEDGCRSVVHVAVEHQRVGDELNRRGDVQIAQLIVEIPVHQTVHIRLFRHMAQDDVEILVGPVDVIHFAEQRIGPAGE